MIILRLDLGSFVSIAKIEISVRIQAIMRKKIEIYILSILAVLLNQFNGRPMAKKLKNIPTTPKTDKSDLITRGVMIIGQRQIRTKS